MQNSKTIHFIGIGGIGISALAYLCLAEAKKVTGSDQNTSAITDELINEGAHIYTDHQPENISQNTELVIYTAAINKESNPEYLKAQEMGIRCLSYFEALGQLTRTKKTIIVMGTHGKTTTTAMLGLALIKAGQDPLVIVGSKIKEFSGKNIHLGGGDIMVVEACEYQKSFLNLQPFGAIFLNCEAEHLDYYKNEEAYKEAYKEMIKQIPADGFLVANAEDENVKELSQYCGGQVINISANEAKKMNLELEVIGDFNQLNALHAYKAAEAVGANDKTIRYGLRSYTGAWRRMEEKGEFQEAQVIDDYGHHPTEIKATLNAIKKKYSKKRLICVFQPHQYSRTHLMANEFKNAFGSADKVMITDIYEARDNEEDKAKMDSKKLVEIIKKVHSNVIWTGDLDNTFESLKQSAKKGDLIVTMGAGSIGRLANKLVQ